MKKHDEGYALVLVLVVIVVLGIVASALLGLSLRNLQSQTDSVDRMVAKYQAAGEIEMVVANLNDVIKTPRAVTFEELFGTGFEPLEATDTTLKVAFTTEEVQVNESIVKISCTLMLTAEGINVVPGGYTITNLQTVEYSDYTITYEKLPEGGGT